MGSSKGGRVAVYIEGHAESLVSAAGEGSAAVDNLAASTERLNVTQGKASRGFASYSSTTAKSTKATEEATLATKAHNTATGKLKDTYKGAAASAGAFIAAYAGYAALKDAVKYTEDLVHSTEILTKVSGLDAKQASQWIELAKQRQISTTKLGMAFTTLSKQIRGAETGSTTAIKNFDQLGISMDEIRGKGTEHVLKLVADRLSKLGDGANRAALNQTFFGKSARDLLPILGQGSKGIQEQLDKFDGLTEAQFKQGEQAIETQRDISRAYDKIRVDVTFAMLSAGKSVAHWIDDVKNAKGSVGKLVHDIAEFMGPILGRAIKGAVQAFKGFSTAVSGIAQTIDAVLHLKFSDAWDGIKKTFSGGITLVTGLMRAWVSPVKSVAQAIDTALTNTFGNTWKTVKGIFVDGANDVIAVVNKIIDVINVVPGVPDIGSVSKIGQTKVGGDQGHANASGPGPHQGRIGAYARGGEVNKPMYMVGEEAPNHNEWVIATNPAYRKDNVKYWAQAGHDLGVPGFALGGLTNTVSNAFGSAKNAVSSVVGKGAQFFIDKLPKPHLPDWMGGLGGYMIDHVTDYIKSKVVKTKSFGSLNTGSGMGNIPIIGQVLLANGLNKIGAAGIIGNALQESGWDPAAMEPGTHNGGLWGFTSGNKSLAAEQAYAARRKKPWTDVATQTHFMLSTVDGGLKASLNNASSAADAAAIFMNEWEIPYAPTANLPRRQQGARQALAMGYAKGGRVGGDVSERLGYNPQALAKSTSGGGSLLDTITTRMGQLNGIPYPHPDQHFGLSRHPSQLDCSAAVSNVLWSAGLLDTEEVSGSLMGWGHAGPGSKLTVYANPDHTFLKVNGRYWGTSVDDNGAGGLGYHPAPPASYLSQFAARHSPAVEQSKSSGGAGPTKPKKPTIPAGTLGVQSYPGQMNPGSVSGVKGGGVNSTITGMSYSPPMPVKGHTSGLGGSQVASSSLHGSPLPASASGLPTYIQSLLGLPGLGYEGKSSIAQLAITMAGETATTADDAAAYGFSLDLLKGNKTRLQKKIADIQAQLKKPQTPKKQATLIKQLNSALTNLGSTQTEISSTNQSIAGLSEATAAALNATLSETNTLLQSQLDNANRALNVSQSQYSTLAAAIADVANGQIGGMFGLGRQTPAAAGSLASY